MHSEIWATRTLGQELHMKASVSVSLLSVFWLWCTFSLQHLGTAGLPQASFILFCAAEPRGTTPYSWLDVSGCVTWPCLSPPWLSRPCSMTSMGHSSQPIDILTWCPPGVVVAHPRQGTALPRAGLDNNIALAFAHSHSLFLPCLFISVSSIHVTYVSLIKSGPSGPVSGNTIQLFHNNSNIFFLPFENSERDLSTCSTEIVLIYLTGHSGSRTSLLNILTLAVTPNPTAQMAFLLYFCSLIPVAYYLDLYCPLWWPLATCRY